ncbi:Farnesylcysteine lyase [Lachnellula subtilissima]|uniref:Farnesylcysteine lyase n=1 Tax=Lachnellula subtilissima TaxID=602034 RepID=A0A8H8RIY2_9HELO|nr:Farnesylcysteine lyase [Lachnellula subtilissima]
MYAGWNLLLVVAVLCGQSVGFFWRFNSFTGVVSTNTPELEEPLDINKRVAIIGAGASGSSTAYYLQQFAELSGIPINITVFERSSYVGGRSTTVNAYGNPLERVELGASIFVDVNTILKNSSAKFGLRSKDSETEYDEILSIWDGEKFVFTQKDSGWQYWDIAKMLWKYGLAPLRTQRLMRSTVSKFRKLYEAPAFPFKSLSDRALDLDLTSVTSLTGEQYLKDNKVGPPFSTDIIQASTRVNYGQNLNTIHGLEAMVCMAIDGAMQIDGGNWQIFDGMLKASNATVHLNSTVSSISNHKGRYSVKSTSDDAITGDSSIKESVFDTVVLAAPLQYSGIDIEKGLLQHTPDEIPYVTLHVTLFTSSRRLDHGFFNLAPDADIPTSILTTLQPGQAPSNYTEGCGKPGFFSISTLRTVINPETLERENLYKVFSPHALTSEFLGDILGIPIPANLSTISPSSGDAITWYYPHVWHSYPYELPRVTFEDSALARNFYYTSGMESFISTMETMALMGMNVAQLVVDDFNEVMVDEELGQVEGVQKIMVEEIVPDEL